MCSIGGRLMRYLSQHLRLHLLHFHFVFFTQETVIKNF